ncbi:MAG: acyl-ACP thioesterase [Herbinix sp.]|jgi:acyl-ACP thioesterase|nr:acyl-ACP thioesterase [Herbinix sp.]
MYSFNSRVRYSEMNHQRGTMDSSSIINYFQDCSTFQSEDMNRGLAYLQTRNRVWLLNSWQLQILRPMQLGYYITIGTWAHAFQGFYGYRNFIMKDEKELVLAVANSIWVYIDSDTGKPTRIPKDYADYQLEPPYPMIYAERKIEIPENCSLQTPFVVVKSNIDSYNHVNNGQYIKMAEEFLPDRFIVQSMRVEYRMQALFGDTILPMVSIENDCYTIVLADTTKKPYAIIEFHGNHTL